MGFFLTGDNSYLSTVQILDSLGPRRVQGDRGGSAGWAGLPEIYRDSSIPLGERGKYAIRVGRTVSPLEKGQGSSFEQTWIPFTQGCFVPNLVEIGLMVLVERIFELG